MKIYIQYCLGTAPTYAFDVDRCTTIKQLKEKLSEKLTSNNRSDVETMLFLHNNSEFFDEDATLEDYQIEDEAIFQAVKPNTRFSSLGKKFANLSNEQGLKKIRWAQTAPEWRRATHGLCLEGKCNNDQCAAFKQSVIMSVGYKRIDILNDLDRRKQDKPGEEPKKCSSNWRMADDSYHYFDTNTGGSAIWRQLIVETVQSKPKS